MTHRSKKTRRGFTLVELLAVVLVIAVLAAVAVPLYINTRRSSAARTCKGNLQAIGSALSSYALRNGQYPTGANVMTAYVPAAVPDTGLIGAPEGLSQAVTCPLGGANDDYTFANGGAGNPITVTCPNAAAHEAIVPSSATANDYSRTLAAPADEGGIP